MGTETCYQFIIIIIKKHIYIVKLNNPLMGTETNDRKNIQYYRDYEMLN